VSRKSEESCLAGTRPRLPRDLSSRSEVPRVVDRVCSVQPFPFGLCRFRPGPSGFLFHSSPDSFTHPALLSASYPSPRSHYPPYSCTRMRLRVHLSWGSVPYSARQSRVPVCPGGSTLRHRPSSGFLTLSTFSFTQNHAGLISCPLRSWGSTGVAGSKGSCDPDRADASGLPLQGFLFPRDERASARSPLLRLASLQVRLRSYEPALRYRVSIAEDSVYLPGATREHQPS
jgi:hypothetical protein